MSIRNNPSALRALLDQKLADKKLTADEATEIADHVVADGVTEEEGAALVEGMQGLAADTVETDVEQRAAINRVMGQVDAVRALPLDRANAPRQADGALNYVGMLALRAQGAAPALTQKTYGGNTVGVDAAGGLQVGGKTVPVKLNPSSDALLEGLWGLARPGQLDALPAGSTAALNRSLLSAVNGALDVPLQDPGKFARLAGVGASLAALAQTAPRWDAATIDGMLALCARVQSPMMKALILRGVDASPMTDAQKTARAAVQNPEKMEELLARFDEVRDEKATVGWNPLRGAAAELALSSIVFSKTPEGVKSFLDGFKAFDLINSGLSMDAEERAAARTMLDGYVQGSEQAAFVFGSFAADAPKAAANVVSTRAVAELKPSLEANPPSLRGFPLTREQADAVMAVLPNIKDAGAADSLVKSMQVAAALFEKQLPSSWGSAPNPAEPMSPAAFKILERAMTTYQERAAASPTGKLDYSDFQREFRAEVEDLHRVVSPRMADLQGTPPKFGAVNVSPEAATWLQDQLRTRLRSSMSVENLGRALQVYADKHGGAVEGAAFTDFKAMVEDYAAQFPAYAFLDFNKLERVASCRVEGRPVPAFTLNGAPVPMAQFFDKVGLQVSSVVDRSRLLHDWQADRWGFRARASIEVLDVVAEQALRGEGPVAFLQKQHPGKTVEIQATGLDGGHEQFIYVVKQNGREAGKFTQGSDGTLTPYNQYVSPVMFTATVGKDGALDVKVPPSISTHRYPLQTSYGVGDKIDLPYLDSAEVELQKEGESFKTRYKVVEARIESFDGRGNYKVSFTTPQGNAETKTVSLNDIRRANNPHYFKPHGDRFSDVTIDIRNDKDLAKFLEGARPIIAQHLPVDGTTVSLSPADLAKRQKACVDALMKYAAAHNKYPTAKDSNPDPNSARYHELIGDGWAQVPLGELVKIERGVCRHQCILQHLLLQYAGIDSRLASGSANTGSGAFRGYHIWVELSLADNDRYLSDQTWSDRAIPLWSGAYSTDKRRAEMTDRTARYDRNIVLVN